VENRLSKVVEAAKLLLSVCDGAEARDEVGYDVFDAVHFRDFLLYSELLGVEGLTPEEVEWMRRKLLRYRGQLKEMGFDTAVLERPVHPVAFYAHGQDWDGRWLRVSPHSLKSIVPKEIMEGITDYLADGERWIRIHIKYKRGGPVKAVWIRINDPDENGKRRKWWEVG